MPQGLHELSTALGSLDVDAEVGPAAHPAAAGAQRPQQQSQSTSSEEREMQEALKALKALCSLNEQLTQARWCAACCVSTAIS